MGPSGPVVAIAAPEVPNQKSSGKTVKWIVNPPCVFPCLPLLPSVSMENTARLWLHRGKAQTHGVVT